MPEHSTQVIAAKSKSPIQGWWAWGATLLSGLLMGISHPPVSAGPLILLAFVPWFIALPGFKRGSAAFFASFLAGFLGYLIPFAFVNDMVGYEGTGSAMMGLWFASAAICATTHGLFATIARFAMRRTTRRWWILTLPLIWMGLEELRYHFPVPSPLMLPGYCLAQIDVLIQIADIGAIHLVSGFVIFVGASIALSIDSRLCGGSDHKLFAPIAMTLGFVLVIGYGMMRMASIQDQTLLEGGPQIAVIQPNIAQEIKNTSQATERINAHLQLTEEALKESPDLVIWSETSYPYPIKSPPKDGTPSLYLNRIQQNAIRSNTPFVVGATSIPSDEDLTHYPYLSETEKLKATYNSALYYGRNGKLLGQFDKTHLVPGGEYIPYRDNVIGEFAMSYANALLQGFETTLIPGYRRDTFKLSDRRGKDWRFSTNICYEFGFPQLAVEMHNNPDNPEGERNVHFSTTLSNEGWYQGGSELDQALIYSRFRAIESRTTVVRATNDGISAVIDANGRVVKRLTDADGNDRQFAGVLNAELPYILEPQTTIYLAIGNLPFKILKWLCLLGFLAAGIERFFLKKRSRDDAQGGVDAVTLFDADPAETAKLKAASDAAIKDLAEKPEAEEEAETIQNPRTPHPERKKGPNK